MKKVLLTGSSGYIGKHITLQLLNEGYEVRATVRNLSKGTEVKNAVLPNLKDQ
jgi:dihydroflavonol-4-reductase